MSAVPYTRDAIKALRFAAANGVPAAEVLDSFGWDSSMLTRVCRTHGIDLPVTQPQPQPTSAIVAPTLAELIDRRPRQSRAVNNVPKPRASTHPLAFPTVAPEYAESGLEQLILDMPNQQRSILAALNASRKVSSDLVPASSLNNGRKVSHVVRAINVRLRLRGLPFVIQHVARPNGGYRLIEVMR